jgi:raffinose/stachyose/melibiose transport system permease protein
MIGARRRGRWITRRKGQVAIFVVVACYALASMFPFVWIVLSAFKRSNEIYAGILDLPKEWLIGNFTTAFTQAHVDEVMLNSLIVAGIAVPIVLLLASMAAYVLTRVVFFGHVYAYFIVGIVIPVQTTLIPTFVLMKTVHLTNSLVGLAVLYAASQIPLAVFILIGFMRTIPQEIEEAARVDGASRLRTFALVVLPLSRAGLGAVGIFTFLYCWNEYLFASVLISSPTNRTLPMGIFSLQGVYAQDFGLLTAGLVISILPVLIVYVLFQEQVVEGATAGAVIG